MSVKSLIASVDHFIEPHVSQMIFEDKQTAVVIKLIDLVNR